MVAGSRSMPINGIFFNVWPSSFEITLLLVPEALLNGAVEHIGVCVWCCFPFQIVKRNETFEDQFQ